MDGPQEEEKPNFHIWRTNEDIWEKIFVGTWVLRWKPYPDDTERKK